VFPVRYELEFYIPEDGILHSHRRENLKSYITCYFLNKRWFYHMRQSVFVKFLGTTVFVGIVR
jgi:hypothetical protein